MDIASVPVVSDFDDTPTQSVTKVKGRASQAASPNVSVGALTPGMASTDAPRSRAGRRGDAESVASTGKIGSLTPTAQSPQEEETKVPRRPRIAKQGEDTR